MGHHGTEHSRGLLLVFGPVATVSSLCQAKLIIPVQCHSTNHQKTLIKISYKINSNWRSDKLGDKFVFFFKSKSIQSITLGFKTSDMFLKIQRKTVQFVLVKRLWNFIYLTLMLIVF